MGIGSPKFKRGQRVSAKDLNKQSRGIQNTTNLAGGTKTQMAGAVLLEAERRSGKGNKLFDWFQIVSVQADYLTCNFYAPQAGSTRSSSNVYVAKPYLLQQTPFDGETITYLNGDDITYTADATDPEYKREHDDGSVSADFELYPNYYVGELVIGINIPTNVSVSDVPVEWIEFCPSGRHWTEVTS